MDKIKKKVVVVGEPGVGKSALVQTYCSDGQQLSKDYVITLVADISSKIIEKDDETDIELFFFDVSGREMLRSAVQTMISDAQLAVFVYDSTTESSFSALDSWLDLLKKTNSSRCPPSILISTKNDYPAMRAVSPDQGQSFAKKIDAKFFQINSLNYQEVEPALNSLTDLK